MRLSFTITQLSFFLVAFAHVNAQTPRTVPASYTSTTSRNYVRAWQATAPEQVPNNLLSRPLRDVKQTTQYADGLGRPLQTIARQGSLVTGGSAVDMIDMVEYDVFGRERYKYLPSPSTASDATKNDGLFKLNPFRSRPRFIIPPVRLRPCTIRAKHFSTGRLSLNLHRSTA